MICGDKCKESEIKTAPETELISSFNVVLWSNNPLSLATFLDISELLDTSLFSTFHLISHFVVLNSISLHLLSNIIVVYDFTLPCRKLQKKVQLIPTSAISVVWVRFEPPAQTHSAANERQYWWRKKKRIKLIIYSSVCVFLLNVASPHTKYIQMHTGWNRRCQDELS